MMKAFCFGFILMSLVMRSNAQSAKTSAQGQVCLQCVLDSGDLHSPENAIQQSARETFESIVKTYSASDKVSHLVSTVERNMNPQDRSRCYAYVKKALQSAGFVKGLLEGAYASQSPTALKKAGFVNLLEDPAYREKIMKSADAAPKGAVMVYNYFEKGSGKNLGHIEIKVREEGKGGYISYRYSEKALYGASLQGSSSPLVGVYILP